jgi:electron transfer flavoprotein alpha/beta subunit
MKLVVLLRSPRVAADSKEIMPVLAPADRAALNTALILARSYEDASVVAVSAGPTTHNVALQAALDAGAARALRIIDPIISDSDLRTTASVLSAGIHQIGFDLVLAGSRSADWSTGATGPAVAHLLGVPHVTSVIAAERREDRVHISHRRGPWSYELLLSLPALITIAAGPSLDLPQASPEGSSEIEHLSLADMTLPFRFTDDADSKDLEPEQEAGSDLDGVTGLLQILHQLDS